MVKYELYMILNCGMVFSVRWLVGILQDLLVSWEVYVNVQSLEIIQNHAGEKSSEQKLFALLREIRAEWPDSYKVTWRPWSINVVAAVVSRKACQSTQTLKSMDNISYITASSTPYSLLT